MSRDSCLSVKKAGLVFKGIKRMCKEAEIEERELRNGDQADSI